MSDLPGRDKSLDPDGYVYVFEFSTGHVKIGQTNNPRQRLSSHTHDATKMGASVARYWFSPVHRDYLVTEKNLIAAMKEAATPLSGREYFTGCDFDATVRLAQRFVGRESTDEERRASEPRESLGAHFASLLREIREMEARCAVEHVDVGKHRDLIGLFFDDSRELPRVAHSDDWIEISKFCELLSEPLGIESDEVLDLNWIDIYEHLIGLVVRTKALELRVRAKESGRIDLLEPFSAAFSRAIAASLAEVSA